MDKAVKCFVESLHKLFKIWEGKKMYEIRNSGLEEGEQTNL
jgi:hypothetical protein